MRKLKSIVITLIMLLATHFVNAQSKTFEIISSGTVSTLDITTYELAISNANMESYRNKTTRDTLSFDSGVKIVLYSAQELSIKGHKIDPSSYVDVRDRRYTHPTFHLVIPNGTLPQAPDQKPYLVALYQKIGK